MFAPATKSSTATVRSRPAVSTIVSTAPRHTIGGYRSDSGAHVTKDPPIVPMLRTWLFAKCPSTLHTVRNDCFTCASSTGAFASATAMSLIVVATPARMPSGVYSTWDSSGTPAVDTYVAYTGFGLGW